VHRERRVERERERERETKKMQLIRYLLSNFYLNMFRTLLCPSSGEQDRVLLHMVFCTGCTGCGCVELRRELCALCEGYCSTHLHTVHTAHGAAPHNHSQPQPAQPVQNTICSNIRSCSPDDGHNDAQIMLR